MDEKNPFSYTKALHGTERRMLRIFCVPCEINVDIQKRFSYDFLRSTGILFKAIYGKGQRDFRLGSSGGMTR
jgi:hypothetical protein